jgi:PhnB protein
MAIRKKSKTAAKKATPRAARKSVAKKVAAIPAGYHTLTPHLTCRGAARAIDFYKKAFGAKEKVRMANPDGSVMHAELQIGNSVFMLGDPMMPNAESPSNAAGLFIYSENTDKAFAKAIAAGATAEMPPADMFWGDRYAKLVDPFGHRWSIATHIEDVSPKEMKRRGQEYMAQMASQQQKG